MNRQKGQSMVEFCLVLLLLLPVILGMIYGAFAYADYLQYNTAVREAARDIAMQKDAAARLVSVNKINSNKHSNDYAQPLTKLYTPEFSAAVKEPAEETTANPDTGSVTVSVKLTLAVDTVLLPKELGPMQCSMPIEPLVPVAGSAANP